MYSLLMTLSLTSVYYFLKLVERYSAKNAAGYFAASLLAVLTMPFSMLIIFAENIYFLLYRPAGGNDRGLVKKWMCIQALLVFCIAPYFVALVFRVKQGFASWVFVYPEAMAGWETLFNAFINFNFSSQEALNAAAGLPVVCPAWAWIGGGSPPGSRSRRPTRTARRQAGRPVRPRGRR